MNNMLQKNLGSANVMRYIWKHGIPKIMTLPPHTKLLTKETLRQMIEQLLTWYASILYSIVEYEKDPEWNLHTELQPSEKPNGGAGNEVKGKQQERIWKEVKN